LIWLGEKLSKNTSLAVAIILLGSIAVGYDSIKFADGAKLSGLPFFIIASIVLAAYVVLLRRWKLTAKQTLAIINLPSAIIFLPLWYFFLPSTLATAGINEILLQALFQGLGPSFFALIFFTYAIQSIGATQVAGFAAVVPATAALLAIPVLGEYLSPIEWGGVCVVTTGLTLLLLHR
jgi:drug/metabolite transporter (DMT)-like permease